MVQGCTSGHWGYERILGPQSRHVAVEDEYRGVFLDIVDGLHLPVLESQITPRPSPHTGSVPVKRFLFKKRGHKPATVSAIGCGLEPHAKNEIHIEYFHFLALLTRQSAALSFATQHAMPPEFAGKRGTEVS